MADKNVRIGVDLDDKASGGLTALLGAFKEFIAGVYDGASAELKAIEADRAFAESLKKTQTPVEELEDRLKSLAKQYIAIKGVYDGFMNSLSRADKLDDLSDKTGIAAGKLKEMEFAATLAGTSLDGLVGAYNKLSRSAVASEDELKKQAQAFEDIGVSVKDAQGNLKDADTLFGEVADKFKDLQDGPEKSTLAFRLFGSEAENLIPLLNKGSEGMKELRDEARELGRLAPDEFTKLGKASGDFFDNLDRLKLVFGGLFDQLNSELVPVMNIFLEEIISSAKEGGVLKDVLDGIAYVFKNVVIPVIKVAAITLDGFVSTLKIAGKGIGALAAAIGALASGDVAGAKQIFRDYQADVAKVAEEHTRFQEKLALSGHEAVKLADNVEKPRAKITSLAKGTKDAKDALAEFVKKLSETNEEFGKDESVKQRIELMNKYNEAIKGGVSKARANALLAEGEAQIALNKALREGQAAYEAFKKAEGDVSNREEEVQLLELEASLIGKSKEERDAAIAKMKEEFAVRKLTNGLTEEGAQTIREEIAALNERAAAAKKLIDDDKRLQTLTKDTMVEKQRQAMDDVQFLYAAYTEGKIKSEEEYVQAVMKVLDRLKDKNKEVADEATVFWKEAAKGIQNSLSKFFFDIMQGKLNNLGDSIKNVFDQLIANALAAKAATALFGADFQKSGNLSSDSLISQAGSFLSGIFGGFRATGGEVLPGRTYMINDTVANPNGELFSPSVPGTIVPNAQQQPANVNITVQTIDAQGVSNFFNSNKRELTQLVFGTARNLNIK